MAAAGGALRSLARAWAWSLSLSLGLGLGLGPGLARAGQVPLLAWSTERSVWPPRAPLGAGQQVGAELLQELLGPALRSGPQLVLLCLLDQLSLEDFTAYGGVYGDKAESAFPQLEGALRGAGSQLLLPAVRGEAAQALPQSLARALAAAPLRLEGAELGLGPLGLNRSLERSLLLLLPLPHGHGSLMSPKEMLAKNDAVLGQLLGRLQQEQLHYTVLLTAAAPRLPHQAVPGGLGAASPPSGGPSRALLGREDAGEGPEERPRAGAALGGYPPLRWPPQGDPPRMLLWASNLSVTYRGQQWDLTPLTFGGGARVDLGGSSWSPQEARLVLLYPEVFGATLNLTLLLRQAWFPVSGRPWAWLAEVEVSLGGGAGPRDPPAAFVGQGAAVPTPLSWRCGRVEAPGPFLLPRDPPGAARDWSLLLSDLQVQAFNLSSTAFEGASDCSSFFTGGVWMGLLSGGLLLGGLLYGGGLLLQLRTMDRFDDPRGPPLPVPLVE